MRRGVTREAARRGSVIRVQGALCVALLLVMSACNGVFYHPDAVIYATPDQISSRYAEHWLEHAGNRLHVWHFRAAAPRLGIALIQFHGNAQNMSSHAHSVAWLTSFGVDVVTFDYRGYGRSTGEPDRQGLVDDGVRVVDWALGEASIGAAKVALLGQSLGGAVVIPAAARIASPKLKAVIVESTFDSYRQIARKKLSGSWLTWALQAPLSHLVSDELSAVDHVRQLSVPLVVIHGTQDPVVPYSSGVALYDAAAPRRRQWWAGPELQHTGAFDGRDSPLRPRLVEFLKSM